MSYPKIDELEALLQTPENKRDNTVTNTGMTSYQQMVERIVDEISSDGVTSDEIESVKQKMLKLPDGETKDFFKKLIDKMENQHEEMEDKNENQQGDSQQYDVMDFYSGFDFSSKNHGDALDNADVNDLVAGRIESFGDYLNNLIEKRFDVDGNEIAAGNNVDVMQVSDVERAAVAVYEVIDCLKAIGVRVDVSYEREKYNSSQPLAYAIHLPHGFEIADIFSITSQDISKIVELQKSNVSDHQKNEPNILMQVVGSEFEQMQQSFREFSSRIEIMNEISGIRKQFQNSFLENTSSSEVAEIESNTWKNFVVNQIQERSGSNERGM